MMEASDSLVAPADESKCGTMPGYRRHRKRGEDACAECKIACKLFSREWRKNPENKKKKYEYNKAYYLKPEAKRAYVGYRRKSRYGISPEQYQAIHDAQGGGCGICGSTDSLVVDHEHSDTPKNWRSVRGLLCHSCNTALGYFGDSVAGCEKHRWSGGVDYFVTVVPRNRSTLYAVNGGAE